MRAVGQAYGAGAGGGDVEEVERGLVAGVVRGDGGLDESDGAAVVRELEVADPMEVEEVAVGDGAPGLRVREGREGECGGKKAKAHETSSIGVIPKL